MISAHGSWATAYRHTNTPAPGHKSPAATRVRSSGLVAAIANNNALAIMNADEAVEQYMQAVDVVGDAYHLSANASDVDKSGSEDHPVPGLVVKEAAVQANTTSICYTYNTLICYAIQLTSSHVLDMRLTWAEERISLWTYNH